MADELSVVAEREGYPDLINKIADELSASSVEELLAWMEENNHPSLVMDPIFYTFMKIGMRTSEAKLAFSSLYCLSTT